MITLNIGRKKASTNKSVATSSLQQREREENKNSHTLPPLETEGGKA